MSAGRRNTKTILVISSALSILLVAIIAVNARRSMSAMSRNNTELYSAYKISGLLKSYRSSLNALENKRKGYIITGDAKFLEAYRDKESEIKVTLKSMEQYFSGKPEENNYDKLRDLTYRRLAENKTPGTGTELSGFQANGQDEETLLNTVDEIRSVADQINESLDTTTRVLLENSVEYVRESRNWSIAGVFLTILVSLAALFLVLRDINTRSLLEKELRRAKQQADENARLKEQFVANMSHEIRTPLNAILGFTNLLDKTKLSAPQRAHLVAIQRSSANLLNIINDILDFSKIEAGELTIEKVAFGPADILDGIRQMFENKAGEKNVQLEVRTDKGVPAQLYGDPNRLTQILTNLTGNAIKFTEKGKVSVSCEIKSIEHDVASVVFRVRDTGIGIPDDKQAHVFERFKQASSDTTRKFGGTGLGLSIVKDLVELQNGEIHLRSREGHGSEFIVTIAYPVAHAQMADTGQQTADVQPLSNGSHRILLAEDNELNRKLAQTYLESFGLVTDIAMNGQEAVKLAAAHTYDLILMDIQMPVMDGYAATEKIRNELHQAMPIIAMTANSISGEKEKCLQMGMNDYLSKPYRESELRNMVALHLSPKTASAGAPASQPITAVDLEDFYALTRGNKKFMREMIELFIDRNPIDTRELQDGLLQPDYKQLRSTAHRMKTSVGFMGLKHLVEPLNEIELLGEKAHEPGRASELVALVVASCNGARKYFASELEKLKAEA